MECTGDVDVDMQFPAIVLPDPKLSAAVSAVVRDGATAFGAKLKDTASGWCGLSPGRSPSVWVQCETTYASPKFVSVACVGYVDMGGAHPNKSSITMNYEVPAIREVHIEELFAPGTGWRAALDRLVPSAFERAFAEEDPTAPAWFDPPTSGAFVVTAQGLRFFFEDQVPFVVGSVHPLVPWRELRPYLRRGGVVANLPVR
jgi:hypothetical protein